MNDPAENNIIVWKAKEIAFRAHHGQKRKFGGKHYITHSAAVVKEVVSYHNPNLSFRQRVPMIAAAWLHDVLEDCPNISPEEIADGCGDDVLNLVCELTNPSKGNDAPRHVRKQMDRDHLKNVSWEAKVIKLCDRLCNLRDLEDCDNKRWMATYLKESRQLLDVLSDVDTLLTDKLAHKIEELENLLKED